MPCSRPGLPQSSHHVLISVSEFKTAPPAVGRVFPYSDSVEAVKALTVWTGKRISSRSCFRVPWIASNGVGHALEHA